MSAPSTITEKTALSVGLVLALLPFVGAVMLARADINSRIDATDSRVSVNEKAIATLQLHDEQRDASIGEIRRRLERMDVQVQFLYDEARRKKETR